jgi:ribosomal protein S18 acetylase RimI-like enzyme
MNYVIRDSKEEDAYELSKLKLKVWKQVYSDIYPKEKFDNYDIEINKDKFITIMNNPNIRLLVVEVDNKLIGYMSYGEPYRKYKDFKQEIGLLYLDQDYPKVGLGTKLFNIAYEDIMKKYNEFFISCNKYNYSARKFYEKMGGIIIDEDADNIDKSLVQVKYLYRKKV